MSAPADVPTLVQWVRGGVTPPLVEVFNVATYAVLCELEGLVSDLHVETYDSMRQRVVERGDGEAKRSLAWQIDAAREALEDISWRLRRDLPAEVGPEQRAEWDRLARVFGTTTAEVVSSLGLDLDHLTEGTLRELRRRFPDALMKRARA